VIRRGRDVKTVRKASFLRSQREMSETSCFSHCFVYFLYISAALFKKVSKVLKVQKAMT